MEIFGRRVKATFVVDDKPVLSVVGRSEEELNDQIVAVGESLQPREGVKGIVVYEAQRTFMGIVIKRENLGSNNQGGPNKSWNFLNRVT